MTIDLKTIAERFQKAAERIEGLTVTVSNTDVIFSRDGYGTYQSASVPFGAIFLSDEDQIGKALDRLEATEPAKAA